jgi:hypothetical protein
MVNTPIMLQKWIKVVECSDVEPGETIRVGADPNLQESKEAVVTDVVETRIKCADGSVIEKPDLSSGQYWHKFVQSAW